MSEYKEKVKEMLASTDDDLRRLGEASLCVMRVQKTINSKEFRAIVFDYSRKNGRTGRRSTRKRMYYMYSNIKKTYDEGRKSEEGGCDVAQWGPRDENPRHDSRCWAYRKLHGLEVNEKELQETEN